MPAWWDLPQRELPWWRRLTLRRLDESKPVRVLFHLVAIPLLLIEGIGAALAIGGLVYALYITARHVPIALLVFPGTWFLGWYVLKYAVLLTWEGLAWVWAGAPGWWRAWRIARGSRVATREPF